MVDMINKDFIDFSLQNDSYLDYNINTKYKKIFDTIHGDISISNIACMFIDTPQFQRLRFLHQ